MRSGFSLSIARCLSLLFLAGTSYAAEPGIKAVLLQKGLSPGDYSSTNSNAALLLYRKMGYNTVFRMVQPPPLSQWNTGSTTAWTVNNTTRTALIDSLILEKNLVESKGMVYCPYYAEWGWNIGSIEVSERAREAIYREARYISSSYYGQNIYSAVSKTASTWGVDPSKVVWTGTTSITIGRDSGENAAMLVMPRTETTSNLVTGQCYGLGFHAALPTGTALAVGDQIRAVYYQEFLETYPDKANVPLGYITTASSTNKLQALTYRFYSIDAVYSTPTVSYLIRNAENPTDTICDHCTAFDASFNVWIESKFPFATGYDFSNNTALAISLIGNSNLPANQVGISNFQIVPQDPQGQLAYPNWEANSAASYTDTNEQKYMRTTRYYAYNGSLLAKTYPATGPTGSLLKGVYGHFIPTHEGLNTGILRRSLDPLSPPHDLITKEMLAIVKAGLGNQEPKYFYLPSDEVFVFRTDNISRLGGNHPTYKNMSNGEFFARMVEKEINRYKAVFNIPSGTNPTAKFIVDGDVFLPFGDCYSIYASSNVDEDALQYWQSNNLNNVIIPKIWIYDSMGPPGRPQKVFLNDTDEVVRSIAPLSNRSFDYIIGYSTLGTMQQVMTADPSVNTAQAHIQHEINMAKRWRDIVAHWQSGYTGIFYTGWTNQLRDNSWNGLYSMAYLHRLTPASTDLPEAWKTVAPGNVGAGQPVLNLLNINSWPPVDVLPPVHILLLH